MNEYQRTRLREAGAYLEEARFLQSENMGNSLISVKVYHALMYTLFALLDISDVGQRSHKDIIDTFEHDWIRPEIFQNTVLDIVRALYSTVHVCDGSPSTIPSDQDITHSLSVALNVLQRVKTMLTEE